MDRSSLFEIPLTFLFAVLLLIPVTAASADFPSRKAGLWEIKTKTSGVDTPHSIKQCIDSSTDKALMEMGTGMGQQMGIDCAKNEIRKDGAGYYQESNCKIAGSTMITKSTYKGDFNSGYNAEIATTYNPPFMGRSSSNMTVTAKWLGPCEPGQNPGDIIMANGMKMNMEMLKQLGGGH